MTERLSAKEKRVIRALAKASSEALRATVLHMRELEAERAAAKAPKRS